MEPGSEAWIDYLKTQKANHVDFDPTMTIYAASRDLMRAKNADWHAIYTLPTLNDYFVSTREQPRQLFLRLDHRQRGGLRAISTAASCGW